MNPPAWIDRNAYPFESKFTDVPAGRMHYVDAGSGQVVLMVHGTATWSFLYRHLIQGLSDQYRVVAPDHLGFGLSEKPENYSYHPSEQAKQLQAFIEALDLRDITLVVHDFGGPIGLPYALDHPQNIKRLVIFNTWLWSLKDDFSKRLAGGFIGSPLGRFLFMRYNFEVNAIMPAAYGDRKKLRPIHDQYRRPQDDPAARHAVWLTARHLLEAADWYDSLWARRDVLKDIPALLLWGMKDPVFGKAYLQRWQDLLPQAQTVTYPQTGHFVQDEQGAALLPTIAEFIGQ